MGAFLAASPSLQAHSASDAYLTLEAASTTDAGTVLRGQWDIALRDLDFVLTLDTDGNGEITWREVRAREEAIARWAYPSLRIMAGGGECRIRPVAQRVADHVDGAYAALLFEATCPAKAAKVAVEYGAFFAVDPSHRCIFLFRSRGQVATALLAPSNARIELEP